WNLEGRLQGQCDIALNAAGRRQAACCGTILGDLLRRMGRQPDEFVYVSSPLSRARETMALMRQGLGLDPAPNQIDPRLKELSFGDWEGETIAEIRARDPAAIAARERDKWSFEPPHGESYARLSQRVGAWYASLQEDTVAVAHGGTARALMVVLRIVPPATAPLIEVEQGVVYAFEANRVTIHR
ncbi:MAG TPA: histidine phosphatase family protein, partial [Xanthobacteraceae bacterium]|nr:histidine phosphatase family protein [Xanthobacteraceae bacterium]